MPSIHLKPISQQTIVITGASSGIGLATARLAAERGAAVVLVARNGEALSKIVDEIRGRGGRAEYVVADVGDRAALEGAVTKAKAAFGGIDSWVNDAGVSVYGVMEEIPEEDHRKLFETNYWGVVHGSLIAAKELRIIGGAIVNVGSVISDRAVIYQGPYSAAKHAVKGFTDSLRMELEATGAPISVSLVKPAGINTTFQEHARNRTGEPGVKVPPPAYDPHLVARAIVYCCETGRRDIVVGGAGSMIGIIGNLFPRTTDFLLEAVGKAAQTTDNPGIAARRDNLYEPREDGVEHSSLPGMTHRKTSLLLEMQMNPVATLAGIAGIGALVVGALAARNMGHGRVASLDPRATATGRQVARDVTKLGRQAARGATTLAAEARRRAGRYV